MLPTNKNINKQQHQQTTTSTNKMYSTKTGGRVMGSLQLLFIHVMLLIKPLTNDEHGGGSLERCIIGDRQYGQISDDQHHR